MQVNTLKDTDWIVHLDEETILTEGSVKGIVNFICEGQHQFGQGVITYVNDGVTIETDGLRKRSWMLIYIMLYFKDCESDTHFVWYSPRGRRYGENSIPTECTPHANSRLERIVCSFSGESQSYQGMCWFEYNLLKIIWN